MNVVHPSFITFKRERTRGFLIKLVVLAASCSTGCSTAPREEGRGAQPAENQVLFDGVRLDRFESDHLRYRARIRIARLDRDSGRVVGEDMRADVFDEAGAVEARITAPWLGSDLRSRRVRLEQGVLITDREQRTLRTETLQYDSAVDELETSAPVEIAGGNFRASGGRLTGQPRAGHLHVEGPATSTVSAPSSRGAR